jgi:hypothetical protein
MREGDDKDQAGGPEPAKAEVGERRDEDGLPLDREPTLDDVRGREGSGRAIAVGCSLIVLLVLVAFWLVRAGLLG